MYSFLDYTMIKCQKQYANLATRKYILFFLLTSLLESCGCHNPPTTAQQEDTINVPPASSEEHAEQQTTGPDYNLVLYHAIAQGDINLARASLTLGANKEARYEANLRPLHIAASHGHLDIVKHLIEQEAVQATVYHNWGGTPLHEAAARGRISIVEYLIQRCTIDVDIRGRILGNTPLHMAVGHNQLPVVAYLLSIGADKEARNNLQNTALHLAASEGHLELVKYLVEEAQVQVVPRNQAGKTPLDMAIEKEHQEIVTYLQGFYPSVRLNDPVERANIKHAMVDQFTKQLQPMWEQIGLNPTQINHEALADSILYHMAAGMPEAASSSTSDLTNDPALQSQVDELLQGLQEGLSDLADLPEEVKTALRSVSVEQFRPQAIELVKQIEDMQQATQAFIQENETQLQQAIAQKEVEKAEFIKKMEERARHHAALAKQNKEVRQATLRQKEEAYRLATAKKAVRDIKQVFIPNSREDDVREIKEDIAYLKEDLEEIAADTPLPQEQRALIGSIADQIDKVTKNLKPLYREMKALAARRGGDKLYLAQDTSHLDASRREAFEKEALRIRRRIDEYPQLARQLLNELQGQREELSRILSERNETLSTYGHEAGYESDPEHDYTSAQLGEYLNTCGCQPCNDQEGRFITSLRLHLPVTFLVIREQLDSEEAVSIASFVEILNQNSHLSEQIQHYNASTSDNETPYTHKVDRISGLLLRAIITAIPTPSGEYFQSNHFNQLKKNMHKLEKAIKQIVKRNLHQLVPAWSIRNPALADAYTGT